MPCFGTAVDAANQKRERSPVYESALSITVERDVHTSARALASLGYDRALNVFAPSLHAVPGLEPRLVKECIKLSTRPWGASTSRESNLLLAFSLAFFAFAFLRIFLQSSLSSRWQAAGCFLPLGV